MNNSKNKRSAILGVVLVGLLVVAYKVMFVAPSEDTTLMENASASERVKTILQQVENTRFDTSIMQDSKFKSLKSIETPLISQPVGRKNPFSEI
jgi:hypothetical protein